MQVGGRSTDHIAVSPQLSEYKYRIETAVPDAGCLLGDIAGWASPYEDSRTLIR